jgi:lysozyme
VNLRELISKHEGRIAHAYHDSLGLLTIGVGHLIDERKGGRLPEHIIDELLDYDIQIHRDELFQALPWVQSMDEVRQAVLVDMYFNMRAGLLGFKETLRHFQNDNWEQAATGHARQQMGKAGRHSRKRARNYG